MTDFILSFVKGGLYNTMEIRKYSFDTKTSFNLNRKVKNTQYFQSVTFIQLALIFLTLVLNKSQLELFLVLFILYHFLLLRAEYIDIANTKNYYENTVNTIVEYIISAILSVTALLLTDSFMKAQIGKKYIIGIQLLLYLMQLLCFLIAERRINKGINKKEVHSLAKDEVATIKICLSNGQKEYQMKDYFLVLFEKHFAVIKRDFQTVESYQFSEGKCIIGNQIINKKK